MLLSQQNSVVFHLVVTDDKPPFSAVLSTYHLISGGGNIATTGSRRYLSTSRTDLWADCQMGFLLLSCLCFYSHSYILPLLLQEILPCPALDFQLTWLAEIYQYMQWGGSRICANHIIATLVNILETKGWHNILFTILWRYRGKKKITIKGFNKENKEQFHNHE